MVFYTGIPIRLFLGQRLPGSFRLRCFTTGSNIFECKNVDAKKRLRDQVNLLCNNTFE